MKYNMFYGCNDAYLRTDHHAIYCPHVFEVDDPDWDTHSEQAVIEFLDTFAAEAVFEMMAEGGMRGQEDEDEYMFSFTPPDENDVLTMKIAKVDTEDDHIIVCHQYQVEMVYSWEQSKPVYLPESASLWFRDE